MDGWKMIRLPFWDSVIQPIVRCLKLISCRQNIQRVAELIFVQPVNPQNLYVRNFFCLKHVDPQIASVLLICSFICLPSALLEHGSDDMRCPICGWRSCSSVVHMELQKTTMSSSWWLQFFQFFTQVENGEIFTIPGEMIQVNEHIFQMGWNHQLVLFRFFSKSFFKYYTFPETSC